MWRISVALGRVPVGDTVVELDLDDVLDEAIKAIGRESCPDPELHDLRDYDGPEDGAR